MTKIAVKWYTVLIRIKMEGWTCLCNGEIYIVAYLWGLAILYPGVSGGTIAFILGIYDELLASISGFFSRNWKKHIGFLLPLGIGIGVSASII